MTVPFKVKAVYEYRSEEPDDLIFDNGQIITVTEDDDADWYTGEYLAADGQKVEGIFPRNFVEKYEPAVPSRPARAPRKVPQPEPAPAPAPITAQPVTEEPASSGHSVTQEPPEAEDPPETEVEQPKERDEPAAVSAPPPTREAPVAEAKAPAAKKPPPPVVEKPSSFKDRIAAFNKPAAAPIAPFKPTGAGTGFIKKPFVAPPPSRNAYVPPPRDPPPQKIYRREEDVDEDKPEPERDARSAAVQEQLPTEEDQPKPTSLKDRIALLQQQQLETAQRQADATKKKEKPKKPAAKPRSDSTEVPAEQPTEGVSLERISTEKSHRDPELPSDETPTRRSTEDALPAATPPLPSRELVSDTNDADDSGAADTEDTHDVSTEEERPKTRTVKSPTASAKLEPTTAPEEDEEDEDTEEEEDPETRRKRELRERMAKMSGGMGMMGMFGAGAAPAARKAKAPKEDRVTEPPQQEDVQRAPPVPIMALPGMSNKAMPKPAAESPSDDEDTSQPTPLATAHDADPTTGDDYVSQMPSRRSTDRSHPFSPQDRVPPPAPAQQDTPQPPQSPSARPVPPPPPPTRDVSVLPPSRAAEDLDDQENLRSPSPPASRPATRAVPPPLPTQTRPSDTSATDRSVPPPPLSPTSPQSRPPPPPPPTQAPPKRVATGSSIQAPAPDDSEDEVTEYDGDYDTDIASSAKHKAALRPHNRDSSIDESALSDDGGGKHSVQAPRAVPPPVPGTAPRDLPPPPPPSQGPPQVRESVDVPRAAPPPIPTQNAPQPRESVESPRAAPPPVPPPKSPIDDDDEYDPYKYSTNQSGLPSMVASLRQSTQEFEESDMSNRQPQDRAPPPPPTERAAPPPPPTSATVYQDPDSFSMSGALSPPPKRSTELARSNTTGRRSADVARPSIDQGFIAADVDLAQSSMWWTQENSPPPALLSRNDVLWEVESSTSQKRGGRASVSRDVYVLYQDYSQSTINATYDASEPSHVSFEQSHERPPMPPRKDQLESASEQFGTQIAKAAEKAAGSTVGEGTAQEFVLSLIRSLQAALLPVGNKSYGALVYANLANASTQQFDEIRPGDVITFRNAKFAGHKGGLHQKYSQDVGNHVGVVIDWDGTKKKLRVWEQGNQEKGKKAKVRDESYRVSDLKSGEVRVWRVMPRSYVNWGTA